MSRKELTAKTRRKADKTWDLINLLSAAIGGTLLLFVTDTPEVQNNIELGQVVGAVLLTTVLVRIAHLVFRD